MRRRHQTGCANELHSFCQSSTIKPQVSALCKVGWQINCGINKIAGLVQTRGQITPLQGVIGEGGVLGVAGFVFSLPEASRPLSRASLAPTDCQSWGTTPPLWEVAAQAGTPLASAGSLTPGPQLPQSSDLRNWASERDICFGCPLCCQRTL